MSPTYAHLCHANRAAFGRKTAYASASCLVAFLSNLAFTKPGVFQVHITCLLYTLTLPTILLV